MPKGPTRLFTPEQEIGICEFYWTRKPSGYYPSYQEVAGEYSCSAPLIKIILKRNNYRRRTNAETREGRPCKPAIERGHPPLCACGCEQQVSWDTGNKRWFKYCPGHYSGVERKAVQPAYDALDRKPQSPYTPRRTVELSEVLTKEALIDLYCNQNRTIREIAKRLDVGVRSVKKAMEMHGIEQRTLSESLTTRGSVRGANNPAWKGGVADWDYSHDWKALSKKIKDRDQWTCQLCGEQRKYWGSNLHVHHIDEDKTNNHPHNLISLCSKCHHPIHGKDDIRTKLHQIAIINTGGAIEHPQFRH